MTGGSLPAMTWHEIMAYAHQGIELKHLPGLPPPSAAPKQVAAEGEGSGSELPARPAMLTRRGAEILTRLEHLMENASRAMVATPPAAGAPVGGAGLPHPDEFATVSGGGQPTANARTKR
jgi:penicillin-binding protein 1A